MIELRIYRKAPHMRYWVEVLNQEFPTVRAAVAGYSAGLATLKEEHHDDWLDPDEEADYGRPIYECDLVRAEYRAELVIDGTAFDYEHGSGCTECGCDWDDREGWIVLHDEKHLEPYCPDHSIGHAVAWAMIGDAPLVHVTAYPTPTSKPERMFARRVTTGIYVPLDSHGQLEHRVVMFDPKLTSERPAVFNRDGKPETTKTFSIQEQGWSSRSRVRGLHGFKVCAVLNPKYNLCEGLCRHDKLSEAQACKAAREAGSSRCINH